MIASKQLIKTSIKRALFGALLIFPNTVPSALVFASVEVLNEVTVSACNSNSCYRLKVEQASRSALDNIYAFKGGTLELFLKSEAFPNTEFKLLGTNKGTDGYYDLLAQRIVMRGIKGKKHKELVLNYEKGSVAFF